MNKIFKKFIFLMLLLNTIGNSELTAQQANQKNNIISFGNESLPDTVPWLNTRDEKYFVGNGIVGGGGNTQGTWDYIIGPDYTSPNFIKTEKIIFIINGENKKIEFGFHRLKGTGIFYGVAKVNNAVIQIVDYACFNQPVMIRKICIKNISQKLLSIKLVAEVQQGNGIKNISANRKNELLLSADTAAPLFGNGDGGNWKERSLSMFFNMPQTISYNDSVSFISTGQIIIPGGRYKKVSLIHYLREPAISDFKEKNNKIDVETGEYNLSIQISEWKKWINSGKKNQIPNARINDIIESMLVGIKMQQNRDGGFIAGTRKYAFSYIRDSHGACRGLMSCGFTEETKKYLQTTFRKFKVFNQIPNSVQMGADLHIHGNGNQYAESPAYILLLARDYYRETKDMNFLSQMDELLNYAADIQISHAKGNNWLLPFNGDETEKYCVKEDGQEYGGFPALTAFDPNDWSMSSSAACIASLDFYEQYLKLRNRNDEIAAIEESKQQLLQSITNNFFNKETGYIDWALKKDNSFYPYTVINFELMPLWFGASLQNGVDKELTLQMLQFINSKTGFIANAPGDVEGFCGHSLAYLLYNLCIMKSPERHKVFNTLINSSIIQKFGMVNEYYGPSAVPNNHNLRCFESGIVLDAVMEYLKTKSEVNK